MGGINGFLLLTAHLIMHNVIIAYLKFLLEV